MRDPRCDPKEITPTADGTALSITWADGEAFIYKPWDLRMACPCAGCVDELTGGRILKEATVPGDVYPEAIHYVGSYALQFMWSDSHSTGYYTFELLRRLGEGQGGEAADV